MTNESIFLVNYISVLLINQKYADALRAIRIVQEHNLTDCFCQANLQRLQGVALLYSRKDKYLEAHKVFENAEKSFTKIG